TRDLTPLAGLASSPIMVVVNAKSNIQSMDDLARAANLNKGQASRSAQALVDRGLVEKTVSASDGRGVVLAPTADGLTQYRRI
ncbi:MarR family transcriptional regulator, partial [Paenibacillus polymyxa]|nr:MarR family transcriptional regulator [Paenibacillus polymyxa]